MSENGLRRWLDKILIGALGIILALVTGAWAMIQSQVNRIDASERIGGERLKTVEVQGLEINRRLDAIDKRQDRMDVKLDQIIEKLKK